MKTLHIPEMFLSNGKGDNGFGLGRETAERPEAELVERSVSPGPAGQPAIPNAAAARAAIPEGIKVREAALG